MYSIKGQQDLSRKSFSIFCSMYPIQKALLLEPLQLLILAFRHFANTFNLGKFRMGELPHAIQTDSSSCGIYVCQFASAMFSGESLFLLDGPLSIAAYRKRIWRTLVRAADNAEDLCHSCGEEDVPSAAGTAKPNSWVRCMNVLRLT